MSNPSMAKKRSSESKKSKSKSASVSPPEQLQSNNEAPQYKEAVVSEQDLFRLGGNKVM